MRFSWFEIFHTKKKIAKRGQETPNGGKKRQTGARFEKSCFSEII
jgi:hypothetical protein